MDQTLAAPDAPAKPPRHRNRQPVQVAIVRESLLRIATVSAITGMCRSTIYNLMNRTSNAFPKPAVRLSARGVRWRAGDVVDWCEAQGREPELD